MSKHVNPRIVFDQAEKIAIANHIIRTTIQNKTPLNKYAPIRIRVKDGVIQSVKQEGKPEMGRQFVENAQLKYNTESGKGPQPTFGAEKTINISEIPKGTKLTQKGNDYYYKGLKVTQ